MCEPAANSPTSVLIVDGDPLVRRQLTAILGATDDIAVVAEVEDCSLLADAVAEHRPDIVLLDDLAPGVERLTGAPAGPKVVVLTTEPSEEEVIEGLRLGVSGFLLKDTEPAELARSLTAAAAGEVILCQPVVRALVARVVDSRRDRAADLAKQLCGRELAVARLIGEGRSNREISLELSISVAMVKVHVSRLLAKLGLHNRVQIALFADSAGLATR